MLVEFRVSNFRSFKDDVTLSMVASADKEHKETHTFNVSNKLTLLKSAVIYGANASGKSNLFMAMAFMRNMVLKSSKESQANEEIHVERFRLSTETDDLPSSFEIIFYIGNTRYRYGFQVDKKKIHNEWLFYVPSSREATLFTRENNIFKIGPDFKEGKGLEKKTRDNALFLSVVAQFNGERAINVLDWFDNLRIISNIGSEHFPMSAMSKLTDNDYKEFTSKFLRVADVGIKEIQQTEKPFSKEDFPKEFPEELIDEIISISGGKSIELNSVHQKYDQNNKPVLDETFSFFKNESAGTLELFGLSAYIYNTLKKGSVLVVDELSSKLHPLLTQAIIEAFHQSQCKSAETESETTPLQAQLIFNCHDTSILKSRLFRRDQIWFTQKNEYGAATLYSLEEYKVRKDISLSKDYIMGKFGAVPVIGDIESLFSSL